MARILQHDRYRTPIIAAAIRNARQVADVAVPGAHCVPAGFSVDQDSFNRRFTDMGHDVCCAAWDETGEVV